MDKGVVAMVFGKRVRQELQRSWALEGVVFKCTMIGIALHSKIDGNDDACSLRKCCTQFKLH